jgi:cytochrome c biogenesis protein CcdA
MVFFVISILAGIFTVFAPCILPLLPVVIGASEEGSRRISTRALVVIGSLSLSVVFFTVFLKATTLFINIPQSVWTTFSGLAIIFVGVTMLSPELLAVVEAYLQWHDGDESDETMKRWLDVEGIPAMRAAIAKAKGESA